METHAQVGMMNKVQDVDFMTPVLSLRLNCVAHAVVDCMKMMTLLQSKNALIMIKQEIFMAILVLLGTTKIHKDVEIMMMLTLLLNNNAVLVEEDAVLQKTVDLMKLSLIKIVRITIQNRMLTETHALVGMISIHLDVVTLIRMCSLLHKCAVFVEEAAKKEKNVVQHMKIKHV